MYKMYCFSCSTCGKESDHLEPLDADDLCPHCHALPDHLVRTLGGFNVWVWQQSTIDYATRSLNKKRELQEGKL